MTFVCPHCHQDGIQFGDRACPHCDFSLGIGQLIKFYARLAGQWLRERLQEATAVQCPQCRTPNPINARKCGACDTPITVEAVTDASLRPARQRMDRLAEAGPSRRARWVAQIAYLGLSIWLLKWSISRIQSEFPFELAFNIMLVSIGVGAVVILVFAWLIPSTIIVAFHRRATWVTKLAVVCNGLTLPLWLLHHQSEWWRPALIIACVIITIFIAARFLTMFIWPTASQVGQIFRDIQGSSFNPSRPQGRRAHRD